MAPQQGQYSVNDGRWIAIGAIEDKFFKQLASRLGLDPLVALKQKRSNWSALRNTLAEKFSTRTADAWQSEFDGTDCCVTVVNSLDEARNDPHLSARHAFFDIDGVAQPAPAPRFSRSIPEAPRAPATTNTAEDALADWLDPATIGDFRTAGAWKA